MRFTKAEQKGKCPANSEQHQHMDMRQKQNRAVALRNPNEKWMAGLLAQTEHKWTRQARWGWRIFDFWNHTLGIAVEVDGPEHDAERDAERDSYNLRRSGILVLRVRNGNEHDAHRALQEIGRSVTWWERRRAWGIPLTKTEKRKANV